MSDHFYQNPCMRLGFGTVKLDLWMIWHCRIRATPEGEARLLDALDARCVTRAGRGRACVLGGGGGTASAPV